MYTENIRFHVNTFEDEIRILEKRFRQDSEDRWFVNYIFISEKIKDNTKLHLYPTIEALKGIREEFSEQYRHKDLGYHADIAINTCDFIKKMMKELFEMYRNQAEYSTIKIRWESTFPSLFKRISNINERLMLLDRILVNEEDEEKDL